MRWIFRFRLTLAVLLCAGLALAQVQRHAVYIPYSQAQPIINALPSSLPPDLKNLDSKALSTKWPAWVASRDRDVRARLEKGEEDSLANLLLYGVSYSKQPRITSDYVAELEQHGGEQYATQTWMAVAGKRADDLVRALAAPGTDERLLTMRALVTRKGYLPATVVGRARLKTYLMSNLDRVRTEYAHYAEVMRAARAEPDDAKAFAMRSEVFEERGLSLDSNWRPNYGLEESLKAIIQDHLLAPGSVRRVAIVGPGLDFIDKNAGYDVYPPQSIQPFAVIDSLLRLGLADAKTLQITTLDISTRVNQHLQRAQIRAQKNLAYTVQLPLNPAIPWKADALSYWEHFGDRVGSTVKPQAVPPQAGELKLRAVRIRPEMVQRVTPTDLNIVFQQLSLPAAEQFDLLIGTNIFVYYGGFEQALARNNAAHMLRPGGLLLSNDSLAETAPSDLKPVKRISVIYSDRRQDGDWFMVYQRSEGTKGQGNK